MSHTHTLLCEEGENVKILVLSNHDPRLTYLIDAIKKKYEITIVAVPTELKKLENLTQYTHLLLPIAGVDNTLTIRGGSIQLTDELLANFKGKTILTGLIVSELSKRCEELGIGIVSYLTDAFMIDNNYLTCEGIIAQMVSLSPKAIFHSKCLIVGFGRLGQILAKILQAFKADISIVARDDKDIVKITIDGYKALKYEELEKCITDYDFIITTVPQQVITPDHLNLLSGKDILILDVSSVPYSFDHQLAERLGIHAYLLPQLPGRFAPKTAGELLAHTIELILMRG